jgi:hypothetical protein
MICELPIEISLNEDNINYRSNCTFDRRYSLAASHFASKLMEGEIELNLPSVSYSPILFKVSSTVSGATYSVSSCTETNSIIFSMRLA